MSAAVRSTLAELASIKPGYAIRSRLVDKPGGRYRIIQPSDMDAYGKVDPVRLARMDDVNPRGYHFVDSDVVLFVAYGTQNRAYHLPDLPPDTVARSTFYLIRPQPDRLAPGFLAWYLNQPEAKRYIEAIRSGATVQVVRRDGLGAFELTLPPLDIQRKMAAAAKLAGEEARTLHQLAEQRRHYVDALLMAKTQNA